MPVLQNADCTVYTEQAVGCGYVDQSQAGITDNCSSS